MSVGMTVMPVELGMDVELVGVMKVPPLVRFTYGGTAVLAGMELVELAYGGTPLLITAIDVTEAGITAVMNEVDVVDSTDTDDGADEVSMFGMRIALSIVYLDTPFGTTYMPVELKDFKVQTSVLESNDTPSQVGSEKTAL